MGEFLFCGRCKLCMCLCDCPTERNVTRKLPIVNYNIEYLIFHPLPFNAIQCIVRCLHLSYCDVVVAARTTSNSMHKFPMSIYLWMTCGNNEHWEMTTTTQTNFYFSCYDRSRHKRYSEADVQATHRTFSNVNRCCEWRLDLFFRHLNVNISHSFGSVYAVRCTSTFSTQTLLHISIKW